ncbi:hypothetical protein H4R24_000642 [Coemansia sp. RSA 988]|nr:hypothetical protein H4R24_000642 [Coemansia sp. RSA 988]
MNNRGAGTGPRSTWITIRGRPESTGDGEDNSMDASSFDDYQLGGSRVYLPLRRGASTYTSAYGSGRAEHTAEEGDDSNGGHSDESDGGRHRDEGLATYHEDDDDEYGDARGLVDTYAGVALPHPADEDEDDDEDSEAHSSNSSDDSFMDDDDAEEDNSEENRHRYVDWDAPVVAPENSHLFATNMRWRDPPSERQPRSKDRSSRPPFMPEYLETTAFGALYNSHMRATQRKQGGVGGSNDVADGDSEQQQQQSSTSTAVSHPAASHVAPDMFFRSLVQDTWPHYCTPVSTMPSFAGLRLGYGLGIGEQTSTLLPHNTGASGNTDDSLPRRDSSNRRTSSWRTSLTQRPSSSRAARGQTQRRQASGGEAADVRRLPSEWSPLKNPHNMEVESDGVTVRYTGPGRVDQDAAMILSDNSIPARTGVYYYEVYIKSRGQNGYIGVGLARAGVSIARLPGWDPGSWGYHGDDGNCFSGDGRGSQYGPRYSTGDTVGCGIDFMRRRIFFTRNGAFLGYTFDTINTDKDLFPCVGMRTPGEYVAANFGRRPFMFEIGHYVETAHDDALRRVAGASLTPLLPLRRDVEAAADQSNNDAVQMAGSLALRVGGQDDSAPHKAAVSSSDAALSIVLMHLLHNEHYGTARALIENAVRQTSVSQTAGDAQQADNSNPRLDAVLEMLRQHDERRAVRRQICKHISEGDIDYALGLLQDACPQVLRDESLVFQLRCRQFVELVRAANGHHIADSVPPDDDALQPPRTAVTRGKHSAPADMMDVDDTQATVMSLAAITSAPNEPQTMSFGQLTELHSMPPAQLVRVLLEYGRQLQADYGSSPNPVIREGLVHAFSLLAYADPAQSPIAALLDPGACKPLARLVDMAIVASENAPRMSSLECIYRQTAALLAELSARRNGAAALISIDRDFVSVPRSADDPDAALLRDDASHDLTSLPSDPTV